MNLKETRQCRMCGKSFNAKQSSRFVTCSHECSRKNMKWLNFKQGRTFEDRNCIVCGKKYRATVCSQPRRTCGEADCLRQKQCFIQREYIARQLADPEKARQYRARQKKNQEKRKAALQKK